MLKSHLTSQVLKGMNGQSETLILTYNLARKLLRAKTKTDYDLLVKKYGLYDSVLLELNYFHCIRFTVIDPMQNLFLGTAKSILKLWIEQNLLSKQGI